MRAGSRAERLAKNGGKQADDVEAVKDDDSDFRADSESEEG